MDFIEKMKMVNKEMDEIKSMLQNLLSVDDDKSSTEDISDRISFDDDLIGQLYHARDNAIELFRDDQEMKEMFESQWAAIDPMIEFVKSTNEELKNGLRALNQLSN